MRRYVEVIGARREHLRRGFLILALLAGFGVAGFAARAADTPPPNTAPVMGDMNSAGWLERVIVQLETEAISDVSMLPDTPSALEREWRAFDRNGSASGALVG